VNTREELIEALLPTMHRPAPGEEDAVTALVDAVVEEGRTELHAELEETRNQVERQRTTIAGLRGELEATRRAKHENDELCDAGTQQLLNVVAHLRHQLKLAEAEVVKQKLLSEVAETNYRGLVVQYKEHRNAILAIRAVLNDTAAIEQIMRELGL
jgi:hypothetical protein